jgi:hypothetical protein
MQDMGCQLCINSPCYGEHPTHSNFPQQRDSWKLSMGRSQRRLQALRSTLDRQSSKAPTIQCRQQEAGAKQPVGSCRGAVIGETAYQWCVLWSFTCLEVEEKHVGIVGSAKLEVPATNQWITGTMTSCCIGTFRGRCATLNCL